MAIFIISSYQRKTKNINDWMKTNLPQTENWLNNQNRETNEKKRKGN